MWPGVFMYMMSVNALKEADLIKFFLITILLPSFCLMLKIPPCQAAAKTNLLCF